MTDTQNALTAKRVGQYLIDAGVLKREQLEEALDRQKRMGRAGFHVLLGTILEEMGAIDRQSLEAIILRQRLDEGSVSLGPDADWALFRDTPPTAEEPAEARNGSLEGMTGVFETYESEAPAAQIAEPEAEAPVGATDEMVAESDSETTLEPHEVIESLYSASTIVEAGPAEETAVESEAESTAFEAGAAGETVDAVEPEMGDAEEAELAADATAELADEPSLAATEETEVEQTTDELETVGLTETDTQEGNDMAVESGLTVVSSTQENDTNASQVQPAEAAAWGDRIDVQGFSFKRVSNGLEESEVSAALTQLVKHVRALEDQVSEAKENLAHLDSMRRYGEQTIKAADTIADQIHSEAEKQAEAIRERAQEEARRIVADAKARHDHMLVQAGERAKSVAEQIGSNIQEHHEVNSRLVELAQRLMATSDEEAGTTASE